MPDDVARADADWLALREPADAAARSKDLVDALRPHLPTDGLVVHDLGCGTGSMARWLAPQLAGLQRWIGYDRDEALLSRAAASPPPLSLDGHPVTTETRLRDITRLPAEDRSGASLVTASALLDMLTREEIERLIASIAAAGCPALVTLSVIGQVDLTPTHPIDHHLNAAFNEHQMRDTAHGRLLGPNALDVAAAEFQRTDYKVGLASSPWDLDAKDTELITSWFEGWVDAAGEQDPSLLPEISACLGWRREQIQAGQLQVKINHRDLLASP